MCTLYDISVSIGHIYVMSYYMLIQIISIRLSWVQLSRSLGMSAAPNQHFGGDEPVCCLPIIKKKNYNTVWWAHVLWVILKPQRVGWRERILGWKTVPSADLAWWGSIIPQRNRLHCRAKQRIGPKRSVSISSGYTSPTVTVWMTVSVGGKFYIH